MSKRWAEKSLQEKAEFTLENMPIHKDDVDAIVQEWCQGWFPEGFSEELMLADLQQIATKYVFKRSGQLEERERFFEDQLRQEEKF